MFGYQRFTSNSADIASASTFGAVVQIEGATKIFLNIASSVTAANYQVCVGNTTTVAQILPLYYQSYTGGTVPMLISTAASQIMVDISQACGFKYMRVQGSIAMVDGSVLNVLTAQ